MATKEAAQARQAALAQAKAKSAADRQRRFERTFLEDEEKSLHNAALSGDLEFVKWLLERGMEINVDRDGTPLLNASLKGHDRVVRLLLQRGALVNMKDSFGITPLLAASLNGHQKVVTLLIKNGAKDELDVDGHSALFLAALEGQEAVVKYLANHEQDFGRNRRDKQLHTPLHAAAQNGHSVTCHLLVASKSDINAIDSIGRTPLCIASLQGHVSAMQLLARLKGDVNVPDHTMATPLFHAVRACNEEMLRALVASGASVNMPRQDGVTPAYLAAVKGRVNIINFLASEQAGLSCPDVNGLTPLHVAAYHGHRNAMAALIAAKGDPNCRDVYGRTPLFYAALCGWIEVVHCLAAAWVDDIPDNANHSALFAAASGGHTQVVEFMAKSGGDVNEVDSDKNTPLKVAAANGHADTVQRLCELGAVGQVSVASPPPAKPFPLAKKLAVGAKRPGYHIFETF
mmetsp:Transcript_33153/g.75782  ORF Transcript_33153/g.75782 Transcript_33153/m.75782 type:complete len:459 (-) Transcript_33153:61-1437(-)|eukprot:CAMPEP_0114548086 /NCGR_PEP_ID=MMETSP0114-20121206/4793_1 /TAXON_ID=31324 /ORGANISM="Goniomonas sp, Strain m" /LENGTH=458 /DNA_ID=CAMNT_0001732651 /DNA_START=38 /DNA_END=1414 /DNA_ORIENTATION=-